MASRIACVMGLVALAGCAPRATPTRTVVWVVGRPEPGFDPEGPPDATRWALERLLTRGLVEEDSSGSIVPSAAERFEISSDRLLYTFHLRPDLKFTDGKPCGSQDFRRALEAGLNRTDHATRVWLLGAVQGVEKVRPGKPLPQLGIEAPDPHTLVLRLSRPDSLLLTKLALPGVCGAWQDGARRDWVGAHGLGPYQAVRGDSARRLVLAYIRSSDAAGQRSGRPDTLHVRFVTGAPRVRSLLRAGAPDLVWPLPPGLLDERLPEGFRWVAGEARPRRTLLLVMRADLPPTSRLPARHALAHGLNQDAMLRKLGPLGVEPGEWLRGAGPFDFPTLDGAEAARWMASGKLGRSFHVDMAYDADGVPAVIARLMQGEWARLAIYVELVPLRQDALREELLRGRKHLVLVDSQSLLDDPVADLAALVMPLRGPAVGSFRTGWRTREADPWIAPVRPPPPLPVAEMQRRLEEERMAVPIARLPWVWLERVGGPRVGFHPHYGAECSPPEAPGPRKR